MTAAITVRGLDVDLGGRPVLRGVDLTVHPGELFALLGPNGAGKTTILRSLLGLVARRGGAVSVAGEPPEKAWRHVGYVPQRHAFAWDFPISIDGVVMSGRTRLMGWLKWPGRQDHRAVRDALATVGLTELRDRPVGELSGGQRQRVLIARALATRPEILLLDEPFTGVDVPTQEMLTTLLERLSHEGTTVLLTTHDLAQAMAIADVVALVNKTVMGQGTPQEMSRPELWMEAFGVPEGSPLLTSVGVA